MLVLILLVGCSNDVETNNNETSGDEASDGESTEVEDVVEEKTIEKVLTSKNSDLKPSIYSNKLYPKLDEEIELKFEVINDGIADIINPISYKIEVLRDGIYVLQKENSSDVKVLKKKTETLEELDLKLIEYGTYKVTLMLDPENSIDELREENNNKTLTIYLKEKTTSDDDGDDDSSSSTSSGGDEDCSDSDDGLDFEEKGTCTDSNFLNGKDDFCAGDERLGEMFCQNNKCNIQIEVCDNMCSGGKCI